MAFLGSLRFILIASCAYWQAVLSATITDTTRQTIQGIGASGGWWPIDLYNFPASTRENVSRLLFDNTNGIGLTDYRYNLGGGGVGVTTYDRAPETPYVSDGVYNFSADPQGTYYLRQAAAYGVPVITLFVNSAPTTMTSNGQNCGGTLITDRIDAYATYIADVVAYWRTQDVLISYVSPMNEPDDSFGSCTQEGMEVLPSQRAQVVNAVASALIAQELSTKVIADESSSAGNFLNDVAQWLPYVNAIETMAGVCHHQYSFASESTLIEWGDVARNLSAGVNPWFTEICCYVEEDTSEASDPLATLTYGASYDPTMISALRMGNLIWESFVLTEDAHWDWWTGLSNEYGGCEPSSDSTCVSTRNYDGWDDGLIYYDPDYNTTHYYDLSLTKRFYTLKHYTQAVPVGAVRVNVTDVETNWRVTAYNSPFTDDLYSVVAMNMQNASSTLTLTSKSGTLGDPGLVVVTSPDVDYQSVYVLSAKGSVVIEALPLSIYTIFF